MLASMQSAAQCLLQNLQHNACVLELDKNYERNVLHEEAALCVHVSKHLNESIWYAESSQCVTMVNE